MKSRLQFLVCLMTMIFFLPSCSEDNSYEEASLKVSENTMQFTKDASEKVLTIQSNRDRWVAMSPQEGSWIELVQEGNSLKVKVKANSLGMERKGIIMVTSGDATEKVEVKQSAADIILGTTPEELKVNHKGGERKVELNANTQDLKVELEGATEWLSLKYITGQPTFTVTIKENTAKADRSAKVIITAGKTLKELKITQAGEPYYILPLLQTTASLGDVATYESQRGGILIKTPDGLFNRTAYRFSTASKVIPFIEYNFVEGAQMYKNAIVPTLDAKVMQGTEFEQFMLANGFTKGTGDKTQQMYTNEKLSFIALIKFPASGGALMAIQYVPKQPKPYETFKTFPFAKQVDWLGDRAGKVHGKKYDTIKDYESTMNSTLDNKITKEPGFYWYTLSANEKPALARAYWFIVEGGDENIPKDDPFIGELEAARVIGNDPSLAFWEYNGELIVTNEFKELLSKEGFLFHSIRNNNFIFYNKAKNTVLATKPVKFKDYNDGKIVLDAQILKMALTESSVSMFMNDKKYFRSLKAEDDAISRKLIK